MKLFTQSCTTRKTEGEGDMTANNHERANHSPQLSSAEVNSTNAKKETFFFFFFFFAVSSRRQSKKLFSSKAFYFSFPIPFLPPFEINMRCPSLPKGPLPDAVTKEHDSIRFEQRKPLSRLSVSAHSIYTLYNAIIIPMRNTAPATYV